MLGGPFSANADEPRPSDPTPDPPPHPLTLDGSPLLHQLFRMRWSAWKRLSAKSRQAIVLEARQTLGAMERRTISPTPGGEGRTAGGSALFAQLGHKGDLMLVHFRESFEALHAAELAVASLALAEYLEPTTSYISVVELGLYDSTVKLYDRLLSKGLDPVDSDWKEVVQLQAAQQAEAMAPRLWPAIPPRRYLCFYPMDKRRGEQENWYTLPLELRRKMMREHGLIGRKFAGRVQQIISGSIGFDDWEWGVDLFADDPLVFKQLIYEMRFDRASSLYALFGPFYLGLRFPAAELGTWLDGKPPAYGHGQDRQQPRSPDNP